MAVTTDEDTTVQDDNPAASTAQDIKAAARDMLRMGSRWAHSALDWIDERRTDMNHRPRDERDFEDRNRYPSSSYASSQDDPQERQRHEHDRHRRYGGRSDRDIQSDFSGGGYDQVGGRDYRSGADWRGREGSYPQSRTLSPDYDNRSEYNSDFGYGSAASGYGSAGAGGVGYGAPGYGAGSGYASANRYQGDFQNDRSWLRNESEDLGGYDYRRGAESRSSQYGAQAREGRHSHESYGQFRGGRQQQDWRARGSAGQGYGERDASGDRDYRMQGAGYGAQASQQAARSGGALGRSYRGVGPRNYTRSDERIREDLNERLTDAHDIDASGISVEVNNGIATLNGSVSERWMKHRAEDIADGCSGVRDVRNMLQVSSQGAQSEASMQSHGAQSRSQGSSSYASQSGGSHAQAGAGTSTSQGATSQGSTGSSASGSSPGTGSGPQYGSSATGSQGGSGSSQYGSSAGAGGSGSQAGSTGSSRGPNV